MGDKIMLLSGILFGVLFMFLIFIVSIFIVSLFMKKKYMAFEPWISVVIPAYNEEKNIAECIDSVFNSDYPKEKIEVIVVDDGSTDKTLKILKKHRGINKNIKILKQNHLGKVEAMNLGSLNASNGLIFVIDADTIIDKSCIKEIVRPFSDNKIGVVMGNISVKNKMSILSFFQNIEYSYLNLVSNSFSKVFNNGTWFLGSLCCYRKKLLEKVGYFKRDTMAEDHDIALEMKKNGYDSINMPTAFGFTVVPEKVMDLYRQRCRWWVGILQSLLKNKGILSKKASVSILFVYINLIWWSFYAFLSLPLIIYQVNYWLPYNSDSMYSIASYLFRWFSLMGPVYVVYNIPNFGISIYSIFGVLSGLITTALSMISLKSFKERVNFKNILAIFFYFPYTIVLNIIILISLLRHRFWEKNYYIK